MADPGNYAFIDSQNVNLGVQRLGRKAAKEKLMFMDNLRGKLEHRHVSP
jgi:hypothetical protein